MGRDEVQAKLQQLKEQFSITVDYEEIKELKQI